MSEIYTFLLFILTGISIGILFDIFRIFRRSFKTVDFITYIQDFLFWVLAGVILLYSIFSFNNGELRGYIFVGVVFGILLYILIFSKLFVKISVQVITTIKKIVYIPIKFILNIIKKYFLIPLSKLIRKVKYILQKYAKKINIQSKIKFNFPKINVKKNKNDKLSDKIQ